MARIARAPDARFGTPPTAIGSYGDVVSQVVVALTGVVIGSAGALAGTAITVRATKHRQDELLRAERERLDRQLAHDRQTRDLGDLREILTAAITHTARARHAISAVRAAEGTGGGAYGLTAMPNEIQLLDAANAAMHDIEASLDGMRVRLGRRDPIVLAFEQVSDAAHQLLGQVDAMAPTSSRTDWDVAVQKFTDLAQARVGSRDTSD